MAAKHIEDFAAAPGETLRESIEALGMPQVELADRTGLDKKTINLIIKGVEPLTHNTALALEKVLRVPARFWINLEAQYRAHLAELEEQKRLAEYADWARSFPYPAMVKNGFIEAATKAEEKAMHLLRYFGVSTPEQWEKCYAEMHLELSFRRSPRTAGKLAGISSWLRQGELLSQAAEAAEFDEELFKQNLQEIRKLTTASPSEFAEQITTLCAEAGVIYQLVPELPGQGISGVMRWVNKRPMIQQSLLFKTNDHFWFTFFHEAKHVLQKRKKSIFLEGSNADQEDVQREEEANTFARDLLIPRELWSTFVQGTSRYSSFDIQHFANEIDIHPGIVSGRLLHEEKISYGSPLAQLRDSLQWA